MANNVYQAVIIRDAPDARALEEALNQVIARHEALRTTFARGNNGDPVQRIHEHLPVHLGVTDAAAWDEDALQEAILAQALQPFDLERGPLLRAHIWLLGPQRYALMLTMHHIITDLWSLALLTYEWGQFYAAARADSRPRAPKLRRQYRDFVQDEARRLADPGAAQHLAFWRETLTPLPQALDLPTDFLRPARQSHQAGVSLAAVDAALTAALRNLAREHDVPIHDLMLAAFQALLHRYTGQDDLVTGVLRAGRTPSFARVIGYFVNTLPLRVRFHPAQSFRDLLAQVKNELQRAVAHELPFPVLVQTLHSARDPARNPIFQALFSWQKTSALLDRKAARAFILHESGGEMEVGGLPLQSITLKRWVTQFDVSLMVGEGDNDLTLTLEYNADILREGTAEAMLRAYLALLNDIAARPHAPIAQLNLVDAAMRDQLFVWGNIVGSPPTSEPTTLPAWFARQAAATPDAVALALGDAAMTYRELDARSNQLAHALLARGIGPEDRVGLLFRPSLDMIVALLGALKAGACYVPLDSDSPADRLRRMIEDSGAKLIVSDQYSVSSKQYSVSSKQLEAGNQRLESPIPTDNWLLITDNWLLITDNWLLLTDNILSAHPQTPPAVVLHPDNAAYIIYTSGTTGRPKGVVVTHANVTRLLTEARPLFDFGPNDVWTLFHSYAFDFSVWEMWGALLFGGRLEIIPRDLARDPATFLQFLADRRITVLNQTPSAFRQLMAAEARRSDSVDLALRWIIFGGEALDLTALASWFQRHGDRSPRLVNMYGITETTVHVTWRPITAADAANPASLIGPPLPHLHLILLDANGQPVPVGAAGEIYVGGAGVARGYHRRPGLTAQRFAPDSFATESPLQPGGASNRLYRSGDLARWTPDRDLQYLGRADHQVKIRGFRVELGEIAAVLGEHPDVRAAVVLPWGSPTRTEAIRLAAYLVPAEESAIEPASLRAWLLDRLPAYMIPAAFVALPELPLTSQGKIDRRALPEPDWGAVAPKPASRTAISPLEIELAAIWRALLGVREVGVQDDFFALGGHSLLVIRLLARIEDRYHIRIPVRDFFDAPTIAALAEEINEQRVKMKGEEIPASESSQSFIINHQSFTSAPLSPAQQRLWLLHQLDPDSPVYHIPAAVRLRGPLDLPRLEAAINRIIARHASLRTLFGEQDGAPVQHILPDLRISLAITDLSGLDEEARLSQALRQARELARAPFDLTRGPLIRMAVWRLSAEDHLLAVILHHIIADGWSMNVFLEELQTFYLDPEAQLPDPPIQYPDYAIWQRERLGDAFLQPHLDFWQSYLAESPPFIALPTDHPRPPVKGPDGAVYRFHIPADVAERIREQARAAGATSFMAFLGAFATLLARYAGQDDLIIGAAVANRPRPELESLIGYFVNALPLRLNLDLDASFPDLLAHTRERTLAAFVHQETPFESMIEALHPPRDLSRTPLFQVMFSLQDNPLPGMNLPDLGLEPLPLDTGASRYDLTLVLTDADGGLDGWLEYSTELWDAESIVGMARAYRTLLENIAAAPDRALAVQPLLAAEEARAFTRIWNPPPPPFPGHRTIPQLFAETAVAAPEAIAAEADDRTFTYGELNARANQLAHALLARGLRPEEPVAVFMQPGLDWLIALLGILKAGGAYLPLDPATPAGRIRYMLKDAGVGIVISDQYSVFGNQSESRAQEADSRSSDAFTHHTLRITSDEVLSQPATNPAIAIYPENAAYVIYTSGTTGRPKGVVIPHRAVARLVKAADYLQILPGQRVAQAANPAFDAVTFEVWAPLLNGGAVVFLPRDTALDPDALADFLVRKRIDALFLTTALFNFIASHRPDAFASLQALLFGGQAVTPHWVRAVLKAGPPQRLLHVYGPTETTTFATWHEVTDAPENAATVPIGLPVSNTTCHVVDETFQTVPPGIVGMLLIGGPGLARGYHHRPGLTSQRFLPDPLDGDRGQRLYLTGDLVRRRRDGAIEFIARADRQLKLRGFRIEPGEIEHALREHPAVEDALVRAVTPPGQESPVLTAYIIARQPLAPSALNHHLARRLPDYMLPAAYLFLDAFPLTPNGKVDERALPSPRLATLPAASSFEPTRTPREQTIADLWAELLGRSEVGRHDDFFALGGHSLLAARAAARLSQALGEEISLRTLFEAPTPAALAQKLTEHAPSESPLPPIERNPARTTALLSFAQQRLWFLQQLEPDSSFYNIAIALELYGPLNLSALETAFNRIIARHESLRTIFPLAEEGPVARILPELRVSIPLYEASSPEEARAFAEILTRQPFRLDRAPLLRVQCYRLADERHVLAFTFHHIIADGWSLGVMLRELATFYRAEQTSETPVVPQLSIQYADFAAWQRDRLEQGALDAHLAYWREQLQGLPPALDFPTDHPRPSVQTYRGEHIPFTLDAELTAGLRRLAGEQEATLFMVTLAAFQTLLHRYAGQDDLAVGVAVANRNHPQLEPLIGFFVNTLVIRADFADDPSFAAFLNQLRETALQAFAHQEIPFDAVVDAVQPPRDLARNPLVQTLFVFQNAFDQLPPLSGLDWHYLDIEPGSVKFDLTLSLAESGDQLIGVMGYAADLFRRDTVLRLIQHYRALLRAMLARPDVPVSRLTLYAPDELNQVLAWSVGPGDSHRHAMSQPKAGEIPAPPCASEPAFCSVVAWIESQSKARPDAVAVTAPLNRAAPLTYAELNARANQLARALIARGVQPGDVAGVHLPRSPAAIIALLGILKAGAAYLPLDPASPAERIRFMLEDAGVKVVIGSGREGDITVDILRITDDEVTSRPTTPPATAIHPENIAYLIYTSGATGRPKGVMIPHRALSNYILAARDAFQLSPADRVLQFASLAFDAAVEEIFATLVAGATLVLRSEEIIGDVEAFLAFCRQHELTVLDLPTSFWHFLAESMLTHGHEPPGTLRLVVIGGERARPDLLRRWLQRHPRRPLILNTYGPTEATVVATMWQADAAFVQENYPAQAPIGRPIPNTCVYVLDEHGMPTPIGAPGELFIGGAGLARGYSHRPGLTAERFVPNPFVQGEKPSGEISQRLYRTGDRVRWLADGRLEFLGRLDRQVKISGYRIEPEEIAAVLAEHPAILEAAVLVSGPDENRKLIAYVIPNHIAPDPIELRDFLRLRVPGYMLPAHIHVVDAFPRTPGGKVDVRRLTRLHPDSRDITPPRTPLEQALAAMWEALLDVSPVGINDDFFALGGDSLRAAIFINRLQEKIDQSLFVAILFDAPTIAKLAALLERDYPHAIARWLPEHPLPHYRHPATDAPALSETDIHTFQRILHALDYSEAEERSYRASISRKLPPAIFILAAPRSGSTLLRVMLAGHPQLFAPPELYLASFHSMAERVVALSGRQRGWSEGLLRAIMEIFDCDLPRARAILARYEARNWPVHRFYRRLQSWLSGRTLVDKTTTYPLSLQTLERIEATFSAARYIHLVRNPHASVHSYLNSGLDAVYLPDTPFTPRQRAELIWLQANRNIHAFLSDIPEERRMLLPFDELVQSPEELLHRLSEFLAIDFHPAMLQPYQGDRMLDGVHPESRMVGDPGFLRHQGIDPAAARAWLDAPLDAPLHRETLLLAHTLDAASSGAPPAAMSLRASGLEQAPLSYAQERLWFLARLQPDDRFYRMAAAVRLRGPLHRDAFIRSLNAIIARHAILRTIFQETDDGPVQRILARGELSLDEADFSALPEAERLDEARHRAQTLASRPFDLANGPLLRVGLYRLAGHDHVIAVAMHHIIADGWSTGVFLSEFAALYRAGGDIATAALPQLSVQYADFALWQRKWLAGRERDRQLGFWQEHLADAPPLLALPTDFPRPAVRRGEPGAVSFHIPGDLTQRLHALARAAGATPFMAIWSAFATLLARYANQDDIVIGTAIANRTRPELEPLIGFFVNTLALRLHLHDNPTFHQLLARARATAQAAFAHADVPFELVVEALQPPRDLSHTPLFQVMLAYQNQRSGPTARDLGLESMDLAPVGAPYDLSLTLVEKQSGLDGQWLYDAALFRPDAIQRLTGHFLTLLDHLVAYPDRPVGYQPILTQAELAQLAAWNDTAAPPPEELIPDLIARQARLRPDAPALTLDGDTFTYAQLDARANQLAHALLDRGVQPEDIIAIHLSRGPELLTAILGVMRAAATFLVLDPALPADRLRFMLDDARARVVIGSQPEARGQKSEVEASHLQPPTANTPSLLTDNCLLLTDNCLQTYPITSPHPAIFPEQAAYVIYTSGTTGQPKGVVLTHGSFANFIADYARAFGLKPGDRMLQFASFAFDAALCESFMALISGAELVFTPELVRLNPEGFTRFLEEEAITVALLTPTVLARTRPPHRGSLRAVIAAGEACNWEIVRVWATDRAFFNGYGPTEATIGCSYHRVRLDEAAMARTAPIGHPIANARLHVVSRYDQLQPVGVPGELLIAGLPVGRGYLHRPALTARRFLPDSFVEAGASSSRLYRTGDLVRRLPTGALEFLGRVDRQVKYHGIRIELSEIEAVLSQHPAVNQAVALLWKQDNAGRWSLAGPLSPGPVDDLWLVAYVAASEPVDLDHLRAYLTDRLPAYMLPARIHLLDQAPMTPTGKVNVRALPSPGQRQLPQGGRLPPANDTEQLIADIWSDLLGVPDVARNDDFFALGGHSLLAARIATRLSQALGRDIPLQWLFQHPTPAALAEKITADRLSNTDGFPSDPSAGPIVHDPVRDTAPLSFAQQRLWFLEQLEPGQPIYHIPLAVRLRGALHPVRLEDALNRIIARHASLRTRFQLTRDGPVQRILPELPLSLPVLPASGLDTARDLARELAALPFDLEQGPLVRAQLYRLDEQDHLFALTLHHIIADGWSVGVLLRELELLYRNPDALLPDLPIQYPDYAHWQRRWLSGERLDQELAFWRKHLAGAPLLLDLPTDFPRPPVKTSAGDVVRFTIPETLLARLHALARDAGATPFMAFWGAFAALLARYAHQNDVIIGAAAANRTRPELEPLIGLFINALALRLHLDETTSFRALLARTKTIARDAFAHAEAPFELVVDAVQPPRDLRITPIFQAALSYNQDMIPPIHLPDLTLEPLPLDADRAKYDLLLAISDDDGRAQAALQYSTDLWRRETIQRMVDDFLALLENLTAAPDAPVMQLAATLPPLSAGHLIDASTPPAFSASPSAPAPPESLIAGPTPVQSLLLTLWRQALHRDDIGIHDNFFEIGGDSILITHIVARAQEMGLRLTARQFFQHPTIAQLAAHLPDAPVVRAEQGRVTGSVLLSPIQQWFFAQNFPHPHHWNQSILLEVAEPVDPDRLQRALRAVIDHHDMLRAHFHATPDGWTQEIAAETPPAFEIIHLDGLPPDAQESEAARLAAQNQAAMGLEEGPIFKMILFDFGEKSRNRVLWIAHHLVVDSVSWRILLTDLLSAYGQLAMESTVHLPPKTTSYRQWSQHLETFARSGAMNAEKTYWLRALPEDSPPFPVDNVFSDPLRSRVKTARYVDIELSQQETDHLLTWTRALPHAELQDALLLSLARTWDDWTGEPRLYLDIESHGRDDMGLPVNLARTVGWFTALYPLAFSLPPETDPMEALATIHRQAREAADHAQTYGLLRYRLRDPAFSRLSSPRLLFNFLGEIDSATVPGIRFLTDPNQRGPERSPDNPRTHLIAITAMLREGRLRFLWEYDPAIHHPDTIQTLAQTLLHHLRSLIPEADDGFMDDLLDELDL